MGEVEDATIRQAGRRGAAWARGACVMAVLGCLTLGVDAGRAQSGGLFTAARVSVDVSASDAVAAKEQALSQAERRAFRTVLRRLAPFGAEAKLPRPRPEEISAMLDGFSVRSEAMSGQRYVATLDFEFQPNAVRRLLEAQGLSPVERRSAPVHVLPVLLRDGKLDPAPQNPWRGAWAALDLGNALTPVQLAQVGSSFDQETHDALMGGSRSHYEALRGQYQAERLLIAVADVRGADRRLATRLIGWDHTGAVDLARAERLPGGSVEAASARAASIALRVIESRWKLAAAPVGADGEPAAPSTVNLRVEFAGLREWQEIRSRLAQVSGVRGISVDALSARSAQVSFEYAGGVAGLGRQLATQNLALHDRGGAWVLVGN